MISVLVFALAVAFSACGGAPSDTGETVGGATANDVTEREPETEETGTEKTMRMFIDDAEMSVDWEDNESVEALKKLAENGLSVRASGYGGFEQVGSLGTSLPRSDRRMTAEAGDIVLYSGDRIVVFYGSNSWEYTPLGKITDKTGAELASLLGGDGATIKLDLGG